MKKRAMAFILCLCIIATMFIPVAPVKALEDSALIEHEGEAVQSIYISETEKKTVSAAFEGDALSYQWQILVDSENEIWASIYDKTSAECEISYALVKNILELSGTAYVRCKITYAEGEAFTNALSVSVTEDEDTVSETTEPMILVSDMQVVEPEEEPEEEISEEETEDEESSEEELEEEPSEEEIIDEESSEDEIISDESSEDELEEEELQEEIITFASYSAEAPIYSAEDGEDEGGENIEEYAEGDVVEPIKEYVTITIHYLDITSLIPGREQSSIYTSYVATVEKGSEFKQNVISPTYLGFAPYKNAEGNEIIVNKTDDDNYTYSGGEEASTVVLNFEEGELIEDKVYNVYYRPIEVPYAVRYFFQNINDDNYTEEAVLYHTHTAVTGTIVSDTELKKGVVKDGKDYSIGFTQMYHIPEAVASDGSTVFEVYYDRNYYLIEFDFNGGYGSDPIYARYGTPFVVNDPVRHGYVFDGWERIDGTPGAEFPKTIPAENQKYRARWLTTNADYTVVYWKENPNDDGYSYWGYAEKRAVSGSTVSGADTAAADRMTDAQHFTFNPLLTDKNVIVEGDGSTVVNVYYSRKYYTITFRANGKCIIDENHVHTDECYGYICNEGNHHHDETCERTLDCTIAEHTAHTSACIICGKTEHASHTSACIICGKTEHTAHTSACTLKCGKTVHTAHTTACYDGVGNKQNVYTGLPNNPQNGRIFDHWVYDKLIYINGSWYKYSGSTADGGTAPLKCSGIHTHDNSCYADELHTHSNTCYKDEIHTHSDSCYKDELHSHSEDCYSYSCNMTEHTHTDACKRLICGMPLRHTHSSSCNSTNQTSTVKIITAKYQANIKGYFPIKNDVGGDFTGFWWDDANNTVFSNYVVSLDTVPGANITFNGTYYGKDATIWYYIEVLPGEEYDTSIGPAQGKDNRNYKLHKKVITVDSGNLTREEEFHHIEGFTPGNFYPNNIFSNVQENNYLYYTRNSHNLEFHNYGTRLDGATKTVLYGSKIIGYCPIAEDVPYPANLEPNAYYFDGWYTTPECFDGTEVKEDNLMPDEKLLLYAKWSPKIHTVKFFHDLDIMQEHEEFEKANENNPEPGENPNKPLEGQIYNVSHGNVVGSVPDPERDGEDVEELAFGGWFYIENGEKKAFTPTNFPIKRDMNIFADWSGESPVPYKISYVLKGTDTKVAEDYTGFAKVGSTKTFNAKAGYPYNQLYPEFNGSAGSEDTFYFPINASHSITMEWDDEKVAANAEKNVHTFEYVQANIPIDYKVKYVDKETGEVLGEEDKSTKKAVVTERFKAFENYVPDAFYKRLVISVIYNEQTGTAVGNMEENVVTFYYSKNSNSAYYAVHYMLEKLDPPLFTDDDDDDNYEFAIDGSGRFEETGTHIEGIGDKGSDVEIIPQKFSGFSLLEDKAKEVVSVPTNRKDEYDNIIYDVTESPADYSGGKYSIKLTEHGTELYIFYKRNEYPYDVYHYKYNSTEPVDPQNPKDPREMAKYGSEVTAEAREIPNWTCVNGEVYFDPVTNEIILVNPDTGKTIDGEEIPANAIKKNMLTKTIHQEEKNSIGEWPENLEYNNIIFYYVPTEYVIEYVAVPPEGGTLSASIETVSGNDAAIGSTPTANENFEFKGWFLDAECTNPVTEEYGTIDSNNKLTPITTLLHPNKTNGERNIFYAKFAPLAGDFTIVRDNTTDEPGDREQVFVYEVRRVNSEEELVITVTITNEGYVTIHDLPLGEYTVTQKNNWSWRYTDPPQINVDHSEATGIAVEFSKAEENIYWLNGNSIKVINKRREEE